MPFLIKAEYVSRRIAEVRGYLRGVHADWLHELAAVGNHGCNCGGNTVNHDVD